MGLQQFANNNAATTCVQLAKAIPQKRNGIFEPLQHLTRQLCQITPQLHQQVLDTFDWPDRGCAKKKVAVQTCKLIPDNKSRNFRSDLCEVLPACIGINKSKMLSWLGWSEALKKVLKPSTPAPCIVLFRSNKKRRSRNSKIPQDWNCAAKRKGYF